MPDPRRPIRNDGKPARRQWLGIPPTDHSRDNEVYDTPPAPPWGELVQPGPKGFPVKTLERRVAAGQGGEHYFAPRARHSWRKAESESRLAVRQLRRDNGVHGKFHEQLVRRSPKAQMLWETRIDMGHIRRRPVNAGGRAPVGILDEAMSGAFDRFMAAHDEDES